MTGILTVGLLAGALAVARAQPAEQAQTVPADASPPRAAAPVEISGLIDVYYNVKDNNSGKTIGLTGSLTAGKLSWAHNYYAGPEKTGTNRGWRHLYDTTVLLTPHPKANFYVNFDYGVDKQAQGGGSRWVGIAGAARFGVLGWLALSPRAEWFNDADGFTTGTPQKLGEVTLTAELKAASGLLSRVEYRRDWSDQAFFERGAGPGRVKTQDTILVGLVAYFAGKW